MNMIKRIKRSFRIIGPWLIVGLVMLMSSCSTGAHVKNLFNYPITINTLQALDTLSVYPDIVKYEGKGENSFYRFRENIRLLGRHDQRPIWTGGEQGSFQVLAGAEVRISDFNFRGIRGDTSLIRVENGSLILENCDFTDLDAWAIEIGPLGSLEVRNVRFSKLHLGAIINNGGRLKLFDCQFDFAGESPIKVTNSDLFEAHQVTITNTMGTAIDLDSVTEVWLDSVNVLDSFTDGIHLTNCSFSLIDYVVSNRNGRNGLVINKSIISGLANFSAVGNLVHGVVGEDIDTLRIVNSELVGNGENGIELNRVTRARISGITVGNNAETGLAIRGGRELQIDHAAFRANFGQAIRVDSVSEITSRNISIVNNDNGIVLTAFKKALFTNNILKSNEGKAALISGGEQLTFVKNTFLENQIGLMVEQVKTLQLDSNYVVMNTTGGDFRSLENVVSNMNIWEQNQSASYYSDMGVIRSNNEKWIANTKSALEAISVKNISLVNAGFYNNQQAIMLNQVAIGMETCEIDSSRGIGLTLMNGSAKITETKFRSGSVGIKLGEGSRAQITQCRFENNDLAIDAGASTKLSLAFSNITGAQKGLSIGNYAQVEILSNTFTGIGEYCVVSTGQHLQSLYLRQNIVEKSGGILKTKINSGKIDIISNTFVNNRTSLQMNRGSLDRLNHNIFHETDLFDFSMMKNIESLKWNCFNVDSSAIENDVVLNQNLFSDPLFDEGYYLRQQSDCLNGGKNGIQIGALGVLHDKRPELKP